MVLVIMTLCPELLLCQHLFTDAGVFRELFFLAFFPLPQGKHAEAFACIMRYSLALMAVEICLKNVYALFAFPRPHYSVLQ